MVWADASRGAGFATGQAKDDDYLADGYTDALNDVLGSGTRLTIWQNGGTDDAGDETESPRLFHDGAGRVCLTYVGTLGDADHVYSQCSSDGRRRSPRRSCSIRTQAAKPIRRRSVRSEQTSTRLLLWTTASQPAASGTVATSRDGGATYSTPAVIPTYVAPDQTTSAPVVNPAIAYDAAGILWIAYRPDDGGSQYRVVVDKSCDDGATWSGPVLLSELDVNLKYPALAMTTGDAPPRRHGERSPRSFPACAEVVVTLSCPVTGLGEATRCEPSRRHSKRMVRAGPQPVSAARR